jgi:hypothetical protein
MVVTASLQATVGSRRLPVMLWHKAALITPMCRCVIETSCVTQGFELPDHRRRQARREPGIPMLPT